MTPAELSLALLLAQTCVAEVGFKSDTMECELMWEINDANAVVRKRSLRAQTKKFNAYWRSAKQRRARPWVGNLRGDLSKPKGWPKHLSWTNHVERWSRYLVSARMFVTYRETWARQCPEAMDYGAPHELPDDHEKMKIIKCLSGKTRQWYWGWRK